MLPCVRRPDAMRRFSVAVAFLALAAAPAALADIEALPGFDLFVTDATQTDLLGIPFEGVPMSPPIFIFPGVGPRAIGPTDTIVRRLSPVSVPGPGMTAPVDIELVHLNLRSQSQLDPDGAGPLPPEFLFVTLQNERGLHPSDPPAGPATIGVMNITFDSPDGGTFGADFTVYADLRYASPTGPIVCDVPLPPCADFDAGFPLSSVAQEWGRVPPPASVRIRDVNRHLEGPGDDSKDFWAGVPPGGGAMVCVSHNGHPDPGGAPTAHGTCATPCSSVPLVEHTGCDNLDSNCDGLIDGCPEDAWAPEANIPANAVLECVPNVDYSPNVTGFANALDDCNPAPPAFALNASSTDFVTPRCGHTFDVDRVWAVADDCGNIAFGLQQIFVVDTTPPKFAVENGPQFDITSWSPGHGYVIFASASLVSATDVCGDVAVTASGCHSSQPENAGGKDKPEDGGGDGNTVEDCVISTDGEYFAVRSERMGACGTLGSRVYTITFTATDDCGNQSSAPGIVRTGHDNSTKPVGAVGQTIGPNDPLPFAYVHLTTYGTGCAD